MSDKPDTAPASAIVPPEVAGGPVDWTDLPAGTYLHARRLNPANNFRECMPPDVFAIYCIGDARAVYEVEDVGPHGRPKRPFGVPARVWVVELKAFRVWKPRLATASEVAEAKKTRLVNWLEANDAAQVELVKARTTCLLERRALSMDEPLPKPTRHLQSYETWGDSHGE